MRETLTYPGSSVNAWPISGAGPAGHSTALPAEGVGSGLEDSTDLRQKEGLPAVGILDGCSMESEPS